MVYALHGEINRRRSFGHQGNDGNIAEQTESTEETDLREKSQLYTTARKPAAKKSESSKAADEDVAQDGREEDLRRQEKPRTMSATEEENTQIDAGRF